MADPYRSPAPPSEPDAPPPRFTTSRAARASDLWDDDPLQRALEMIKAIGPGPHVRFVEEPSFGPGAVAVLVDDRFRGWMSAETFAEFKRRLAEGG